MLGTVLLALENKCRLDRSRPVLAGVSGGADSLCLLDSLYQLGYPLIVAHLDHQLRPGSMEEALQVKKLAEARGLEFVQHTADIQQYAKDNRQSIEEAAREVRYRFLFEQARKYEAQAVATGHTANDQVETVLMHFLRGSGLAGLSGMEYFSLPNPWDSEIPLVRPLLGVWRVEILRYLEERSLTPVIDESNQDLRYYRNRLRHDLIPRLEELNPGAASRIWQAADILYEDERVLQSLIEQIWLNVMVQSSQQALSLDRDNFCAQPLAIRRRLIRKAISQLRPGLRNIDFDTVERALRFVESPSRTLTADLADGLRLEADASQIWLADWTTDLPLEYWPSMDSNEALGAPIPGSIALSSNCTLNTSLHSPTPELLASIQQNQDPWQAWLDLDRLKLPLQVRPRLPGDRFQPFGMQGHSIKLSDYMINQQIPRRARPRWPLIVSGEAIAWVPGYTIGEAFGVKPGTLKLLHLAIMKERRSKDSDPALF